VFRAWLTALESLGYKVAYRTFIAADYGDPTTRERLFIQCQRGGNRIVWPEPTHAESPGSEMFGPSQQWVGADKGVIDWSIPMRSIFTRKTPLKPNTLRRIAEGLEAHGGAAIIAMENGGRTLPVSRPLPTVTTAKGGGFGVAYHRAAGDPISLVMEYYGNGRCHPVKRPLPTVTTRDRFALIRAHGGDVLFRMLRWPELAAAQGFRRDYKFTGTGTEITKQIGNAVPRNLARALVLAAVGQCSEVGKHIAA
jgi:DNA (cytosine-5)-methyltransferase 1